MKLTEAFQELENTLVRNVANHIIQYEFHSKATEEELIAYYGGNFTNREALLDDTLQRLASDQKVLQFVKDNHANLIETYGEKDPAGDIGISLQRSIGSDTEPEGVSEDAGEDGESEPGPGTDDVLRSEHSSDEDSDSSNEEGGNGRGTKTGGASA